MLNCWFCISTAVPKNSTATLSNIMRNLEYVATWKAWKILHRVLVSHQSVLHLWHKIKKNLKNTCGTLVVHLVVFFYALCTPAACTHPHVSCAGMRTSGNEPQIRVPLCSLRSRGEDTPGPRPLREHMAAENWSRVCPCPRVEALVIVQQ